MNDMEQRLLKKAKDVKLFSEVNISRHDAFLCLCLELHIAHCSLLHGNDRC